MLFGIIGFFEINVFFSMAGPVIILQLRMFLLIFSILIRVPLQSFDVCKFRSYLITTAFFEISPCGGNPGISVNSKNSGENERNNYHLSLHLLICIVLILISYLVPNYHIIHIYCIIRGGQYGFIADPFIFLFLLKKCCRSISFSYNFEHFWQLY